MKEKTSWSECHWLVFDAVGTLIYPNPSVAEAYHRVALRYGSHRSVQEIGERFQCAFERSESEAFPSGPPIGSPWISSDAIEIARWRWIVGEVIPDVANHELCFTELWDHFASPSAWSCFDDVALALRRFRSAGFRLAIASNFDSRLHKVCEAIPALDGIERRFVSSETGFRKPHPQFYANLVSQTSSLAEQLLMIGDDEQHDVIGPRTAGMHAILLHRQPSNSPPHSIRSLDELVNRLSSAESC